MNKTESPHHIQEFRFRLNLEALANEQIAYLRFPWERAINEFTDFIKQKLGRELVFKELPPFQPLNAALVALSTTLVHGFEEYKFDEQEIRYLVLPADAPRPQLSQLITVVQLWIANWIDNKFKNEITLPEVQQARLELLEKLDHPEYEWEEATVDSLWPHSPFIYQAIPSLLAKYLVKQKLTIFDLHPEWRLSKGTGKGHLSLVSQPLPSEAGNDRFAYVIEFIVQTVPGDAEPYVDLHVHCRRYMSRPVEWLNRNRKSTVMVGLKAPLIDGWPFDTTLIPLQVDRRGKKFFWRDQTRHLLEQVNIRALIEPDKLAANPSEHWFANDRDKYFWIYAQGMQPDHELGTGFSPGEMYEVFQQVAQLTDSILTPIAPLERDMETFGRRRTAAELTVWELMDEGNRQVRIFGQSRKTETLDDAAKQQLKIESGRRAVDDKPLYLLLLYRAENSRLELRKHAQMCLPAPDLDTHIIELQLQDELTAPFPEDASTIEFQRRRRLWKKFLQEIEFPNNAKIMALIEVPRDNLSDDDEKVKTVIREVCMHLDIGSQLFVQPKAEFKSGDTSRAKNAVTDLLVRQTGTIFGDIRDIYRAAGLPGEVADHLTVIGLYRRRTSGSKAIDFPLAVRVLPIGKVEMCWPGQIWLAYHQATLSLGQFFKSNRGKKNHRQILNLNGDKISSFIEQVCLMTNSPTLVLVEAHDFRGVWPTLQNPKLLRNELRLTTGDILTPASVPDLRLIRLRTSENHETPQYVRVFPGNDAGQYEAGRSAESLHLARTSGPFPMFHSIGQMPQTTTYQKATDPKTQSGGDRSYKHQRIMEIIPIFMQPGDQEQAWARLVDYLRYTPAWHGGDPTLPLPNHLAVNALQDVLCLL
ncbi:MAG: DUF3962 domain-containing protein [Anaerolineae bacterium]|nr:DUF3962 domain-containing protein [Anaerolineae bacterium]